MSEKLVLIDGHSIMNRAFYGVPDLTNREGLHTNAIFGFLNIMFRAIETESANYLAVAFDRKEPTFRHEIFKEYKGTRKPMPQELREQIPVIKEVLTAMGVLIMEKPGLEADDILGTMAKRGQAEGLEVVLISGDRDLLQIADEHIKISIPKTKSGKTEIENYFPADVEAKYGVNPQQFIELKALMGDSSDNIPGVPKIGEKTASSLMQTYGCLDGIYEHLDDISKVAIRESLRENKNLAELSKVLATIEINADLPFKVKDGKLGILLNAKAYPLIQKLEFKSLLAKFNEAETPKQLKLSIRILKEKSEVLSVFKTISEQKHVGIGIFTDDFCSDNSSETTQEGQISLFEEHKIEDGFFGLSLCWSEKEVVWVSCNRNISKFFLIEELQKLYSNETAPMIVLFDSKQWFDCFMDSKNRQKDAQHATNHFFDTLIAAYLLNPLKNDYDITDIANEHLNMSFQTFQQLFKKLRYCDAEKENYEKLIEYAGDYAYTLWASYDLLKEQLNITNMWNLFVDIEMPLTLVLFEMEKEGILIRPEELRIYGKELQDKIIVLEQQIIQEAGMEFNINSPKQLGEVLFEKLGLPGGKKTKTGYSTAADVLEKLAPENPIVANILEYRGLTKLKSTYADGLENEIGSDGRIHTNFHQTITATGRISSTAPNLQNIPIRMELGRKIRKVFVPRGGCLFMDADYSQIELRILAHMSEDEQLIDAYKTAEDIHRITASKVFHVPFEEVTPLQRRNAKAVNFGIVYGISSFGLSQDLSISRKEAAKYIEEYFETYPGIRDFLKKTVEDAKAYGYSETMYHRRRPIPELSSSNFMQRSFGERVAMNAPIQGTAADIMKIAMIHVRDTLIKEGLQSKILLQVHDELLLEVFAKEEQRVKEILTKEMENAANLSVHLDIDLHVGENWYEAK